MFFKTPMLRIKNLTVSLEENVLCKNQNLDIDKGLCVIVGEHGSLRSALGFMYTNSSAYDIAGLDFYADFELDRQKMTYNELKRHLNPFIHFDMEDTVGNSLMFVNYDLYEDILRDFKLDSVRNKRIIDLNVSLFKVWEMAIAAASQSKIVYVTFPFVSEKKVNYYIRKLKKYLKDVDSYIFLEVYDNFKIDFENALVVREGKISSIAFSKKRNHKRLYSILMNEFKIDEVKIEKRDNTISRSKDFYGAYITNIESSTMLYSSFENTPDVVVLKKGLLESVTCAICELTSKVFLSVKFIFLIFLRMILNVFFLRIGRDGLIVILRRSFIFLMRKIKNQNKTNRLSDLYTSLGVLTYFYLLLRFLRPIILCCIYVLTRVCDFAFALLFTLAFEGFIVAVFYVLVVLRNTKASYNNCSRKLYIFPYQSCMFSLKDFVLNLNKNLFTRVGGCHTLFRIVEVFRNVLWNVFLSVSYNRAFSFYKWSSVARNINAKNVILNFYEAGARPLTILEFNVISVVLMGTVLYSNYTLIEEDEIFIKESLYVTIHPLTYYVFVLSYCFISTLPLLFFSLLTNSLAVVSVYFNVVFFSSFFNTFINSKLKIIIISLLMIYNFIFSRNFTNFFIPQLPGILHYILYPLMNYVLFCVFLTLFI